MENIGIKDTRLIHEMKDSYLDYAMSVIVARALPDVRDGLKPVHRRIIHAMNEMSMYHTKPHKKSARIVGEVLGKFHPHGDAAVYNTMVRMAQEWSFRYQLVDGHGNFGSIDGDNPAAMRYTEARMQKITMELIKDIEKNTVEFRRNYDDTLDEPVYFPAKLPNLLLNGSTGIAVGMATNMPPHNLVEILNAVEIIIDNPEIEAKDLMNTIQGPDFPTGGTVLGRDGILKYFETGRGKIKMRAKANIVEAKNGRSQIIVSEIPYAVTKTSIIEKIVDQIKLGKITGIADIRDESDKDGLRIAIDVKKTDNPNIVLNQLYKFSQLESTFGVINLVLVNERPEILGMKEILNHYIEHRKDVIVKRTKFELENAEKKAHILEGLKVAIENIDAVIKIIRNSKNDEQARQGLMEAFQFSVVQAQAILDMRLKRLTSLEIDKIIDELNELIKLIAHLKAILADMNKVLNIIKEEITELKQKYGDERKTIIVDDLEGDFNAEALIKEEKVVISISHSGYIKRVPVTTYKKQVRGGKGKIGANTKQEDFVKMLFVGSTHDDLLIFTDKGQVYKIKVHQIPEASRISRGKAIINLIQIAQEEKIRTVIPIKKYKKNRFLVFSTKKGVLKKTSLAEYESINKSGKIAIKLDGDDNLVDVALTDGTKEIIVGTAEGYAVRMNESEIRSIGRVTRGVKGVTLKTDSDYVVGMQIVVSTSTLLTITENGYGKRTNILEYRNIKRGGKGVINIITDERNGKVVNIKECNDEDEILIMTRNGILIRIGSKKISVIGRNTKGVRLIRLNEDDFVSDVEMIVPEDEKTVDVAEKIEMEEETISNSPDEEIVEENPTEEKVEIESKESDDIDDFDIDNIKTDFDLPPEE